MHVVELVESVWSTCQVLAMNRSVIEYSSMRLVQMVVCATRVIKGRQANPANLSAAQALDAIATLYLLDVDLTPRALLSACRRCPLVVPALLFRYIVQQPPFFACHSFVRHVLASDANRGKTRRTSEALLLSVATIHLAAVGRRAVFELVWLSLDVGHDGRFHQAVELLL